MPDKFVSETLFIRKIIINRTNFLKYSSDFDLTSVDGRSIRINKVAVTNLSGISVDMIPFFRYKPKRSF